MPSGMTFGSACRIPLPLSLGACTLVIDPNLVIDVIAGCYGSIGICVAPDLAQPLLAQPSEKLK